MAFYTDSQRRPKVNESKPIEVVAKFWNVDACGSHFIKDYKNKQHFYEKYLEYRYSTLCFIPLLVPFSKAKAKSVLDIGCGNGADGAMFAINGAKYTGVDLTQTAVDATRDHFKALGLTGNFQIENAEKLSFADNTFDIVYSFGVLHHTPNPAKAIKEVFRVLKPNGKAIVMLYHKYSFNYFIRILGYMRLRVLIKVLSRLVQWSTDRDKLLDDSVLELLIGNQSHQIWNAHYSNFLREGWKYLKASNFIHHCTDGPECPYAYVFRKSDVRKTFSMFKRIEIKVAHFPLRQYLGEWVPRRIEKMISSRIGWNLLIFAEKL